MVVHDEDDLYVEEVDVEPYLYDAGRSGWSDGRKEWMKQNVRGKSWEEIAAKAIDEGWVEHQKYNLEDLKKTVEYWQNERYEKMCSRNKKNRAALMVYHSSGSTFISEHNYKTGLRGSRGYVSYMKGKVETQKCEKSRDIMKIMNNLIDEANPDSVLDSKLTELMGEDKHPSIVREKGKGITKRDIHLAEACISNPHVRRRVIDEVVCRCTQEKESLLSSQMVEVRDLIKETQMQRDLAKRDRAKSKEDRERAKRSHESVLTSIREELDKATEEREKVEALREDWEQRLESLEAQFGGVDVEKGAPTTQKKASSLGGNKSRSRGSGNSKNSGKRNSSSRCF